MKLDETNTMVRESDIELILRKLENINQLLEGKVGSLMNSRRNDSLLSTEQACAYLEVSRTEIYRITKKGSLAYTKRGGRRFYSIEELDKFKEGVYYPAVKSII